MFKTTAFALICILLLIAPVFAQTANDNRGTLARPIIDSRMSKREAFDGLDANCPPEIRRRQRVVKVKYYSFDGVIHQG